MILSWIWLRVAGSAKAAVNQENDMSLDQAHAFRDYVTQNEDVQKKSFGLDVGKRKGERDSG